MGLLLVKDASEASPRASAGGGGISAVDSLFLRRPE